MLLKEIRKHLKKTQSELAYRLGISQPKYSQIERGLHKPSETERVRIAQALNRKFDEVEYPSEPIFENAKPRAY